MGKGISCDLSKALQIKFCEGDRGRKETSSLRDKIPLLCTGLYHVNCIPVCPNQSCLRLSGHELFSQAV